MLIDCSIILFLNLSICICCIMCTLGFLLSIEYFLFLLQLLVSILNFEYDIVLEINALGFMALPGTCNIAGSFLFHND